MTLSGGGSPASTASDPTTVNALPRYSNPLAFATSASVVAGVPTTLSVTYTSDNGSADIASGQVRIDACYLLWDRSGHVVLYSPQGGYLIGTLGNSTVLSPADGGCSIDLSDSSLSTPAANPKALVLKLDITFPEQNFFSTSYSSLSPDFVGPHEVYAEAISVAGLSTGQVDLGSLVVSQGQDFTLTFGVSEAMLNLGAGATLNVPLTATGLNGFNGNIALLGQVIGAGASCFRFVGSYPASIPANSQTTISIQNNNCPGEVSLSFNFNGSAIGIRRYTNPVQVRNASAGDFNVGVGSPSPAVLTPQYRVTYPVTVSSTNGQTGNVSLSLNLNSFPLPAGVTYSLAPSVFLGGSVTSYLTLYGSTLTPPGTYPVQVVAMLGSTQRTTMFSLSTQVTTFQVTSATGSAIVHNTGQEVQVTHTVTAGTVPTSATCGSADPNVSCRVISTASGTVTLGITAATGATHGTRVLSLNGSAAKVHAAIANNGAQLTGLWPSNIYAGDPPTTATINVLGLEFCECTPELIVDAPVIGDIYDWGANISATFYAASSTPAGLYGVWVNMCGGYWDAWDDINSEACVAGPLELQVNAAPPPPPPAPTLTVAVNGRTINSGDTVAISPTDPPLQIMANLLNAAGSVTWRLHAQYNDPRGTSNFDEYYPPTGPFQQFTAGSPWSATRSTGGIVTVLWSLNGGATDSSFSFIVKGINSNPAHSDLLWYLGNNPWYLPFVAGAESTYLQFDPNGLPIFGTPDGYGVMQIDSASGATLKLNLLYNWKDNADEGRIELQTKNSCAPNCPFGFVDATSWWNNQLRDWGSYNAANPTQQIPMQPDLYCGKAGTTTTPQYLCSADSAQVPGQHCRLTGQDPPPAGTHHFRDAITLKMYNGASRYGGAPTGNFIAFVNNGWYISNFNLNGKDYVSQVCNQQP